MGLEQTRDIYVQPAAIDGDSGSGVPAGAWDDPSRWDISLLQPYLQRFSVFFHEDYLVDVGRSQTAAWFGDNWRVSNSLTMNLGVRYESIRKASIRSGCGRFQS